MMLVRNSGTTKLKWRPKEEKISPLQLQNTSDCLLSLDRTPFIFSFKKGNSLSDPKPLRLAQSHKFATFSARPAWELGSSQGFTFHAQIMTRGIPCASQSNGILSIYTARNAHVPAPAAPPIHRNIHKFILVHTSIYTSSMLYLYPHLWTPSETGSAGDPSPGMHYTCARSPNPNPPLHTRPKGIVSPFTASPVQDW